MTAAHETNEIDGPHEGPIKTPKQLILAVLYAFVVPIFGIILLVMYVTTETRPSAGSEARAPKSIAERIRPVGMVEIKDASDAASMKTRRAGLRRAVHGLPCDRRAQCAQARRRRRLGSAHRRRLQRAAPLGDRRQGADARAGRRRLQRVRNRPGGGLHGQPGRRQVPRAGGACRRRFGTGSNDGRGQQRRAGDDGRCRSGHAGQGSAARSGRAGGRRCRRDARPLHPGLHRLPRPRRGRRAEDRRQGGLGAAPRPRASTGWWPASSRARTRCRRAAARPPPTPRSRRSSPGWSARPSSRAPAPRISRPRAGFFLSACVVYVAREAGSSARRR